LSLISPSEDRKHARIINALKVNVETIHLDGRLLNCAHERVNLACRVVCAADTERKKQREKQWFTEKASEAGLKVDDDGSSDGSTGSRDPKSRSHMREAERARQRLRMLLSEPMKTQRYGKFLSTNSAYAQRNIAEPVAQAERGIRRKRRRR